MNWWDSDNENDKGVIRELQEVKEAGWTTDKLLVHLIRHVRHNQEVVMATLQDVIDAVDQDKSAVEAAAARVTADLGALSQQIADLQAQLDAGTGVTAADLDSLKSGIDAVTGEAGAIDTPSA